MPRALRIVLVVLLLAAIIVVLFTTVFPWVERTLEQDPTVLGPPATAVTTEAAAASDR